MNGKKTEKDFFLVIFFALIALSLNIWICVSIYVQSKTETPL